MDIVLSAGTDKQVKVMFPICFLNICENKISLVCLHVLGGCKIESKQLAESEWFNRQKDQNVIHT